MTARPELADVRTPLEVPRRVNRSVKSRILQNLLNHLLASPGYRVRMNWWNNSWNKKRHPEPESIAIPSELSDAISDGWLWPGGRILDIGCGAGETSAWLAARGFRVTGMDYSASAIALAQSWFSKGERTLTFENADICDPPSAAQTYDFILDKGCFQCIPYRFRSAYVQNLCAYSKPGTRYLLFIRLDKDLYRTQSMIAHYFSAFFEIERFQECDLQRMTGVLDTQIQPALAVRMHRRG